MVNVSRFEIINRYTKEKVAESLSAVIHKEFGRNTMATYTISSISGGVTQNPLLIFASERFSVTNIIEDRMGLSVSDDPNMVFILHFSPSENNAADVFCRDLRRRSKTLDPISDRELVSRAFNDHHET